MNEHTMPMMKKGVSAALAAALGISSFGFAPQSASAQELSLETGQVELGHSIGEPENEGESHPSDILPSVPADTEQEIGFGEHADSNVGAAEANEDEPTFESPKYAASPQGQASEEEGRDAEELSVISGESAPVKLGESVSELMLQDEVIDARGTGLSAIALSPGSDVTIRVSGACSLIGDVGHAGIYVPEGARLKLVGDEEACSLAVIGNGGVDYSNTEAAKEANWTGGCGIGGEGWTLSESNSSNTPCPAASAGYIEVDGRNALTLTVSAGGRGSSGIGGGYGGTCDGVFMHDLALAGVSGGCRDAEAETSNNKPEYAKQTLEGGPAIGNGTKGASCGDVTLDNVTGFGIVGGGKSAAIGGGCWAKDVHVSISRCRLSGIVGGTTGAGIGSGRAQSGSKVSVIISDSEVEVFGGYFGAGVGLGANGSNYALELADVIIWNSHVTACGGAGAAGIGGGVRGYNVNVSITDGSTVTAYAGAVYQGKYTEKANSSGDTVTEAGTIGQAGAAAIGRGAWGSVNFHTGKGDNSETAINPSLSVSGDSNVLAYASGDNWAIAGFTDISGIAQSILQLRFSRNYDLGTTGHATQAPDERDGLDWEALFADMQKGIELHFQDGETLSLVRDVSVPAAPDGFSNGYSGSGRLGYHSVAMSIAEGSYRISTTSDLRSLTKLGEVEVSPDDDKYLGGASHFTNGEMKEFSELFEVSGPGFSTYDQVAFRSSAQEPTVEPERELEPINPKPGAPESTEPESDDPGSNDPQSAPPEATEPRLDEPESTEPTPETPESTEPEPVDPKPLEPGQNGPESAGPQPGELEIVTPNPMDPEPMAPSVPESSNAATPGTSEPESEPPASQQQVPATNSEEYAEPATTSARSISTSDTAPSIRELVRATIAPFEAIPSARDSSLSRRTPTVFVRNAEDAATPDAVEPVPNGENASAPSRTEEIADVANPLAASVLDGEGPECWVHWFILLDLILSAVYGTVVVARRKHFTNVLDRMDRSAFGNQ